MSSIPDSALPYEESGLRLLRRLGAGAMGTVYEAEQIAGKRRIAVKVLSPGQLTSEDSLGRFHREAKLAASISHPNCVFVYGVATVAGSPAIVMELLPGNTLADELLRENLPPIHQCVEWILQIIDGLEAAHAAGVLHRDVKPGNCFFADARQLKVGDFGLARATEDDQGITQTGSFIGTPLYASPEAVKGKGVEMRSDMYSVGATLYAMLTGMAPFHGSDQVATMMRILTDEPQNPRAIRGEIAPELAAVVLKCLGKQPGDRFASYAELRRSLVPFADAKTAAKASAKTSTTVPREHDWTAAGLIGDFKIASVLSRTPFGKVLRARDPQLERDVWIHLYSPILPERKFPDVRPATGPAEAYRQRLIRSVREGSCYEVYEAFDGATLRTALESGTFNLWPNLYALLVELCDFLAADPRPRSVEQLWIDPSGRLRVLDFAIGECPSPKAEPRALVAGLAREISAAGPREAAEAARKLLAEIAEPSSRLASVADVAFALQDSAIRPRVVTRSQRLLQGALAVGPALALLGAHASGAVGETPVSPLIVVSVLAVLSTLAAAVWRGSATLRLFKLAVERRDGRPVTAGRLATRALVPWIPLALIASRADITATRGAAPWVAAGAGALLCAAHLAAVLADPGRGLFERATDTRVVPR